MANRTATYIAFDALGETNPTLSDFKYFSAIRGWSASKASTFTYVDAHEKTYAVRDDSKLETLKARIRQRLAVSKNILVILSPDTRKTGSMLSYEVQQAVDVYKIPLICAYTGYVRIFNPEKYPDLTKRWPTALAQRINNKTASAIHIPFKQSAIEDAIGQFTVQSGKLKGSLQYYSAAAHDELGCR